MFGQLVFKVVRREAHVPVPHLPSGHQNLQMLRPCWGAKRGGGWRRVEQGRGSAREPPKPFFLCPLHVPRRGAREGARREGAGPCGRGRCTGLGEKTPPVGRRRTRAHSALGGASAPSLGPSLEGQQDKVMGKHSFESLLRRQRN